MFTMSNGDFNQDWFMAIQQQQGDRLYCYPFYSWDKSLSILFEDYKDDTSSWMHIACVYDLDVMEMTGYMYFQNDIY